MARQVVFDTETTGLSAESGDRILEIGCVELLHRKLTGRRLHLYINPERESEEGALRVHGLTTEFLSDKPKFAEVADQILDFMRDAEIIIHNAAFDVGFINKELERLNLPPLASHVAGIVDTLALAKEMFPGKRNSLDALCDRLGVDNSARTLHGALLDAELLADVYIALTRGQEALLIDLGDVGQQGVSVRRADFSALDLPVIRANEVELSAHAGVLTQLDKSSSGKTVWRVVEPEITGI